MSQTGATKSVSIVWLLTRCTYLPDRSKRTTSTLLVVLFRYAKEASTQIHDDNVYFSLFEDIMFINDFDLF